MLLAPWNYDQGHTQSRIDAIQTDPVVPSLYDKRHQTVRPPMPTRKTEALTIRLCPETKAALRHAAEQERRSLANMVDVMIRHYCDQQTCTRPSALIHSKSPLRM